MKLANEMLLGYLPERAYCLMRVSEGMHSVCIRENFIDETLMQGDFDEKAIPIASERNYAAKALAGCHRRFSINV